MSSRPAARSRPAPAVVVAATLVLFCLAWFGAGMLRPLPAPVIGWLPLPVLALLAVRSCRRAARRDSSAAETRRFWRWLGASAALLLVAVVVNAYDAVGGPQPTQQISHLTLVLYLILCLTFLVALLRLPTWRRSRGAWFRFAVDAGIVLVTVGEIAWFISLRRLDAWTAQTGSALTVVAIVMVCTVATVAFIKLAFAGAGRVNRGALLVLASGLSLASLAGGLSPLLIDRPHLSATLVAAPLACLAVQLAADRQVRDGDAPVADRRMLRRWSILPYVAIGVADTLLLATVAESAAGRLAAVCAVALSGLVVARQISALKDNRRLLRTVDANLEQMRQYQEQLAHQVTHDSLTEIANRSLFAERVTEHLATGEPFHVALLDLDDFKVVNDRLGHGVGDALLRAVSRRLPERLRATDVVARLGGDEFTLLLPGLTDGDVAALLLRLLHHVQEPLLLEGHEMVARVSIGVTASRPGDTPEELIRRADVAMYAAKSAGGGRWTWFDPIMDDRAAVEARLSADLRQAAARGELSVVYQPIVELPHGRLAGVEALLRWRHPEHGMVSPAVFVPLAERSGTIVEIGAWVLDQVIAQATAWERAHGRHAPGRVTVNVSARQLQEPGFAASVASRVHDAGLDPARLVAEVTETAVLGTGSALEAVRELHDLGVQVALDDFGTGHSSLSLLVTCPVHLLKVDKSFVDGVTAQSPQAVIVDSLIGITDGLAIQAVAEGVETAAQAERLHRAGYRYAQGFHFARPMPAADIDELLHTARRASGAAPVL